MWAYGWASVREASACELGLARCSWIRRHRRYCACCRCDGLRSTTRMRTSAVTASSFTLRCRVFVEASLHGGYCHCGHFSCPACHEHHIEMQLM